MRHDGVARLDASGGGPHGHGATGAAGGAADSAVDGVGQAWPAGLREAFEAYERALAADDTAALAEAFEPGEATMRGDGAGLLVGADEIARFRTARGGVASRRIGRVELRPITPDVVLVVSVSHFDAGGRGLQTQLWRRTGSDTLSAASSGASPALPGWRIAAAHASPRPAALDRRVWRAVGDPLVPPTRPGVLDGLRVAVKDLFDVAGQRRGSGNPAVWAEATPAARDADAVARLRAAGAAIVGIAATDEFAYSLAGANVHYGTPPNPTAPGHLPGGSSSGPATAVALGQADVGLATDTAGSIRVPASYQGLWGLRSTLGRVPTAGLAPLAEAFDTVGWLTRDAATLARVLAAGLPDADAPARVLPTRVVVPEELDRLLTPGAVASFRDALARLQALGALGEAEPVRLPEAEELRETFRVVQGAQAWATYGPWVCTHPGALGADVAERFAAAAALSPGDVAAAHERLAELRAGLRALAADAVLVLPSAPSGAPRLGEPLGDVRAATLALTSVASVGGLPAVSAPLLHDGELPLGLGLLGAPGDDAALVALAATWARALAVEQHVVGTDDPGPAPDRSPDPAPNPNLDPAPDPAAAPGDKEPR
ncbi:AtzH-like domain-containing protein [Miniimonas arenae]|uniref:AtzH-like domain-containing protein n=2 Tax=Miniimonas arenae TaxID=676201 RepID=UPI001FE4841E|nr:AtzH-like domain-containing protein [Miniimonas arenae]